MQSLGPLQRYLDTIGQAVMVGDWQTYRNGITLPFHLVTPDANLIIAGEDTLRAAFDEFRSVITSQRATDYIRLAEASAQLDDRLISGRYVTHLLSGGHRIVEPFHSQITLRMEDGHWRAASITNALANSHWANVIKALKDKA